jgi:hypothetical protein
MTLMEQAVIVPGDAAIECLSSPIPSRVFFVRSKGEEEAVVRVSSLPLCDELCRLGIESRTIHPQEGIPQLHASDCIAFHYNDREAVAAIRNALTAKSTVVCLGSDIYSLSKYVDLHDLVSYYLVPTDMHRLVLSGILYKPVYTLPESVDQLVAGSLEKIDFSTPFPKRSLRRVCWFGYVESFDKGMSSLVPVIKNAISTNQISRFTVILDTMNFYNRWNFDTIEFDITTFPSIMKDFDYVILSHFPLDLKVNSLIKSPNKAITSLFSGVIPLASSTPSYEALFTQLGISHLLFSSPRQLANMLSRLDPLVDSQMLQQLQVREALRRLLGSSVITQKFLDHYRQFRLRNDYEISNLPLGIALSDIDQLYFSEHVRALGSSGRLALKSRLQRLISRGHRYNKG